MDGIRHVFAVKDAAFDVALSEDDGLFGDLKLLERLYQIEIALTVRLVDAFNLALDEERTARAIFIQLVLPPADRNITPERVAVVEIGADDGCFDIKAQLHRSMQNA